MSAALILASTALPFVLSPGASFTITVNGAANGDRWSGLKVWTGTGLGILLISLLAGLTGIGTIVAKDPVIRMIFEGIGGSVLVAFGLLTLAKEFRGARSKATVQAQRQNLIPWSFVAVLTNVKALSLYALVVPAISNVKVSGITLYLGFAGIHLLMLLAWLCCIGFGVRLIPGVAKSRTTRLILSALAAIVMIGLGIQSIASAFHSMG